MVGDKTRKRSTEDKVSISRENIKVSVSQSINNANFNNPPEYMMRKIKADTAAGPHSTTVTKDDPPSPKLIN